MQDSGVGETVPPRLILWRYLSNSVQDKYKLFIKNLICVT